MDWFQNSHDHWGPPHDQFRVQSSDPTWNFWPSEKDGTTLFLLVLVAKGSAPLHPFFSSAPKNLSSRRKEQKKGESIQKREKPQIQGRKGQEEMDGQDHQEDESYEGDIPDEGEMDADVEMTGADEDPNSKEVGFSSFIKP